MRQGISRDQHPVQRTVVNGFFKFQGGFRTSTSSYWRTGIRGDGTVIIHTPVAFAYPYPKTRPLGTVAAVVNWFISSEATA